MCPFSTLKVNFDIGADSIVLGPPQMSFASSLHSPSLRKSNKDPTASSTRNRSSLLEDEIAFSASPQEDEEEAGWSKVRSSARGNSSRGFDKRGARGERKGGRESYDGVLPKGANFRNNREGESQNWRGERTDPQSTHDGRQEDYVEFLEKDGDFGESGGGGREHSAEEFQEWITKMRGGNIKPDEVIDTQNDTGLQNGSSNGIFYHAL
jgi:hypothetical protein